MAAGPHGSDGGDVLENVQEVPKDTDACATTPLLSVGAMIVKGMPLRPQNVIQSFAAVSIRKFFV